jgi:hypothetical protein
MTADNDFDFDRDGNYSATEPFQSITFKHKASSPVVFHKGIIINTKFNIGAETVALLTQALALARNLATAAVSFALKT